MLVRSSLPRHPSGKAEKRAPRPFVVALMTAVAAVLVQFLFVVDPVAADPPSAPVATSDAAAALMAAKRSGKRVEVSGQRTETAQVFALPNGNMQLRQYAVPVRVKRPDGTWVPIDTTLRRTADGTVEAEASPVAIQLSGGGAGPLVTIRRGEAELALGWRLGELPAPSLERNAATYADVLPGVDLKVRAEVDGFSETLVVKSREAAGNPALEKVVFAAATKGLKLKKTAGGLVGVDASGAEIVRAGAPVMWDSTPRPAEAGAGTAASSTGGGRVVQIPMDVAAGVVTMSPDKAMLESSDTKFPVYIEPAYRVGAFTMINKAAPTQSYWNYDRFDCPAPYQTVHCAKVGYSQTGSVTYRSILSFGLAALAGKQVLSAMFSIDLVHSWNSTPQPVDLHVTGAINENTNWNNHVGTWSAGRIATANAQAYDGVRRRVEFGGSGVLSWTRQRAGGTLPLGLKANSESNTTQWKKFDADTAYLAVTYNSYPNQPSQLTTENKACATGTSRPFVNTTTPTLRALVSDPDGAAATLGASFVWTRILPDGTYEQPWPSAYQAHLPSGVTAQLTLPTLVSGQSYAWRMQVADNYGALSAVTGWCEFAVDAEQPAAPPGVASTDGTYPSDGACHGGLGRTGKFTFTANGVSDVVSYEYGFADPPALSAAPGAAGEAVTVAMTPEAKGATVLYARSVDAAGNRSAVKTYPFCVGPATGPVGAWNLDDGSGTSSTDVTGNGQTVTFTGGVSWARGYTGWATSFNGAAGGAVTASPVLQTDKSFAVAAWVRLGETGAFRTFVSQDGERSSAFYLQYRSDVNRWAFTMRNGDTDVATTRSAVSADPPALDTWVHLIGVYDAGAGEVRLFVNGVPQVHTWVAPGWVSNGPLAIGRGKYAGNPTDFVAGDVDDVRVWDRAIVPNEALSVATEPRLAGEWLFAEGSGTTAQDTSGAGYPAALTGGSTWGPGHDELGALAFNGVNGCASTAGQVIHTNHSFSVSVWALLNSKESWATIISNYGNSHGGFYLDYWAEGDLWYFLVADDPDYSNVVSTTVPPTGVWTHLVAVFDAGADEIRLYVNGELHAVAWQDMIHPAEGMLRFGCDTPPDSPYWLNGSVDDVRVYGGVLSADQITALYAQ